MSWYGKDTFKQDMLDALRGLLDSHDMTSLEASGDMLGVVSHLITTFDYESDVYKKARADALAEIYQKIGELHE